MCSRSRKDGSFHEEGLSEQTKANLVGWPITVHDRTGARASVCVRLMVTGKCVKENCRNAHLKPASLGQANVDAITTRLAEIYQAN
jgi:hypothetical protein